MSQRSAGSCTRCTHSNAFPVVCWSNPCDVPDLILLHIYKKFLLSSIGNPPPGSAGGGATPSAVGAGAATPATLATALALVPAGLAAIAVFPPYNIPREIPAVSVIFAEAPTARYEI